MKRIIATLAIAALCLCASSASAEKITKNGYTYHVYNPMNPSYGMDTVWGARLPVNGWTTPYWVHGDINSHLGFIDGCLVVVKREVMEQRRTLYENDIPVRVEVLSEREYGAPVYETLFCTGLSITLPSVKTPAKGRPGGGN
jgi:hypothetical protein